MRLRKDGWQCNVEYHKDYVIKRRKSYAETRKKVLEYYVWLGRKGLLDKVPHLKPAKGVIIVKDSDGKKIKRLLKKYKARLKLFNIDIKQSMLH